jgi:hypothetical protein
MKSSTLPNDLGINYKYSSKTACELYGMNDVAHCDPIAQQNPQELNQVTGASVDKAWGTTTGRPDVIIAVHDSGIMWDNLGDMNDLNNKVWLNACELPIPGTDTFTCAGGEIPRLNEDTKPHDVNGDGIFNIKDFCEDWHSVGSCRDTRVTDLNGNTIIDPEDLIFRFSDGVDQGSNGYVDDFVGWDAYEDDNDPFDDVHYGHGTGQAGDSTAEADNGSGTPGTCPNCMVMPIRVGDSFVADVNDFAQGAVYAVDNGASVLQSALGTLNNSRFAQEAIDYAWRRGVILVASAADESAGHHNLPSVLEHAVTMNASGDPEIPGRPASFLEFRGCTNYGAYITATVPANSCSSEAVGRSAGMAGLAYASARNAVAAGTIADYGALDGIGGVPAGRGLSAEEVDQLISTTADDYNFTDPLPYTDRPTIPGTKRYGATPGWDPFFGYGRINARRMAEAVGAGKIPPEADITSPQWFEIVDPDSGPIQVEGLVASRRSAKYSYTLTWAPWSWRGPERNAYTTPAFSDDGVSLAFPGDQSQAHSGVVATIDPSAVSDALAGVNGPLGADGPAVDPATGRGDHENNQTPDKFGVILRLTVTAKDALGVPITTKFDSLDGGGNPNTDKALLDEDPLVGVATKNFNFHDDPALFPGMPRDMVGDGGAAPRFADLDDDGTDELIVATSDGAIHAYEAAGGEVQGWPVYTTPYSLNYSAPAYQSGEISLVDGAVHAAVLRSPTLVDLDRDGDLEVLAGDFEGRIGAFRKDGSPLFSTPLSSPNYPLRTNPVYSSPQPEDLAAGFYTQHPELVPGDYPGPGALPNDPNRVPDLVNRRLTNGPFRSLDEDENNPNRVMWWSLSAPTAGNLDQDRELEIILGASDGHLYQWNADGSLRAGWPVKLRDPSRLDADDSIDPVTHLVKDTEADDRYMGGAVIVSPALADVDGDQKLDILATVNEFYPRNPNTDDPIVGNFPQEDLSITPGNGRIYRLHRDGFIHGQNDPRHGMDSAYFDGWPVDIANLAGGLLPIVGEGSDGSPVVADALSDPGLEISIYSTAGPAYVLNSAGQSVYGNSAGKYRTLQTEQVGAGSNSPDSPSVPAVSGAIFSKLGPGPFTLVVPSAGLGKLLDLALPEDQLQSDNHLSIYDLTHPGPGQPGDRGQVPAFPREVNDLQFLATPASADIDGDGNEEVLEGSAYSDFHAFALSGDEPGLKTLSPDGWPKFTGGWTVAPPAVGDWDGDGLRDIAHVIREGYLFVWHGNGAQTCDPATWPEFGHDNWNTNNVETDATRPSPIKDLKFEEQGDGSIRLIWTAPGDDGRCQQANSFEIRSSKNPITTDNFGNALLLATKPAKAPGSEERYVTPRICEERFYAVRTLDADPKTETAAHPVNFSAGSINVSTEATTGPCKPAPTESPTPSPTPSPTQSTPRPSGTTGQGRADTSLAASDELVAYRDRVKFSGEVTATGCSGSFQIDLRRRRHGSPAFTTVKTVTTGIGSWSTKLRPKRNATYVAEVRDKTNCDGQASDPVDVLVQVKIKVSLARCEGDGRLTGHVFPDHEGSKVVLQRFELGWRKVDSDKLDDFSAFKLATERCKGRFRIVWPKQGPKNEKGVQPVKF